MAATRPKPRIAGSLRHALTVATHATSPSRLRALLSSDEKFAPKDLEFVMEAAITIPRADALKLLIEHGVAVNRRTQTTRYWVGDKQATPLLFAIAHPGAIRAPERPQRMRVVELLLAAGADTHPCDALGRNVFWHALHFENGTAKAIVKRLLAKRPDLTSTDRETRVAVIHQAARCGHANVVKACVAAGVDVNLRAKRYPNVPNRETPLELAQAAGSVAMVRLLKRLGATA